MPWRPSPCRPVPPFALLAPLLLLAAPPALRADRARFTASCVTLAVLLPGWWLSGVPEGAWIFLPSALLLLCAAFADPRTRATPATATVCTFAAVVIAVLPGIASLAAAVHLLGG